MAFFQERRWENMHGILPLEQLHGDTPMQTVQSLYGHPEVSDGQLLRFWSNLSEILNTGEVHDKIVRKSLSYLYQRYDVGGFSYGRSMRSLLLESAMDAYRDGDVQKCGKLIAFLVSMYHNHEHIEKHGWYDGPLAHGLYGSRLEERVHLCALAHLLKTSRTIPDISNYTNADFLALTKD
jgi:hypothetical protein